MVEKRIYLDCVLEQAPRLIGQLDRNPLSETYGCFDRQYWHYKTTNFSCARSQEAVLTLTLLYLIKDPANPYYNNKKIFEWINAALNYWTKIQRKNGSFSEWYINENSFVATAFSSYAVSEVLLLLKNRINEIRNKGRIFKSLIKSGNWLLNKDERRAQNQECGVALTLYNIYLVTKDNKYKKAAEDKIKFILENQIDEGWFNEYGGADIGYLSLAIDYLAKYYKKSRDETVFNCLKKAVEFISHFILPNFTFGGIYGSRNTEYLIPSGFESLVGQIDRTDYIAQSIRKSLSNKITIGPYSFDDRYLSYISYVYLQAYLDSVKLLPDKTSPNFEKVFKKAGLIVVNKDKYYIIINFRKGGVFSIYFKKSKKMICDSGLEILRKRKKLISSWMTKENDFKKNEDKFIISGNFYYINPNKPSPILDLMLRSFQLTVGRSGFVSDFLKNFLRDKLITKAKPSKFKFNRVFELMEDKIKIIDSFDVDKINKIIIGNKSSYIYIPSSRYFQNADLDSENLVFRDAKTIIREIEESGEVNIFKK